MTDASKDMYLADDWISAPIADRAMRLAAAEALRRHSDWTEVVAGLDGLAVQFDPERTDPATARLLFQRQLGRVESGSEATAKTVTIPICYNEDFGPDLNHVADRLQIHADDIPAWHAVQLPPPSAPSHCVPAAQHPLGEASVPFQQLLGIVAPSSQVVLQVVPWARKPSAAQVPRVPWPPGAVTPSQ